MIILLLYDIAIPFSEIFFRHRKGHPAIIPECPLCS
jgi:hypothetical protein